MEGKSMQYITMRVDGEKLVIEIDQSDTGTASKSGKSEVIATTRGNAQVPGRRERIGLNVYRPR